MSVLKLRLFREVAAPGPYARIRVQFFFGPDVEHFQLGGEVRMRVGEWQIFGAALSMGAKRTEGQFALIVEGEHEALR